MKGLYFLTLKSLLGAALAVNAAGQTASATAAQAGAPRDRQAVSLLGQSLEAMTKGKPIQDIKLEAQATRTAGSDADTGPALLEAAAYDKSSVNLSLTSGPRIEARNGAGGVWSAADMRNHAVALHNTWTAAAWFAPALVVQSWVQDSSFSLVYAGVEDRDGTKVYHIRASRSGPGDATIAALSATDMYLDSQSLLPVGLTFSTHPDNDLSLDLPVEVTFASYQLSNGILAPTRIQNFLQNSLLLDLSVAATSANTGLPASEFELP
jgi:hypothetical protein